jgi:hypothetical protein
MLTQLYHTFKTLHGMSVMARYLIPNPVWYAYSAYTIYDNSTYIWRKSKDIINCIKPASGLQKSNKQIIFIKEEEDFVIIE